MLKCKGCRRFRRHRKTEFGKRECEEMPVGYAHEDTECIYPESYSSIGNYDDVGLQKDKGGGYLDEFKE